MKRIVRRRWFVLLFALVSTVVRAQAPASDGFLARYEQRVARTLAEQPHWATPLITVNPRLEQGFRTDFSRQNAGGATTWNLGGAKGLQFVPFRRVEIRLSPPPFFEHSAAKTYDGFGDVAFRLKYRIAASPEEKRNAILTFDLNATVPTGKNGNGSCCATISPVLEAGKGIGKLAMVTTLGGSLPVTGVVKLGRSIAWNNAVEYHATKLLWVETEFSTTSYLGGKNDGHTQTFALPGVIVSRIPLNRIPPGTPGSLQISLAAGQQWALTRFHTYDHAPVFSARLRF